MGSIMKTEDLIQHYGSQAAAAKAIGFTRQAVSRWRRVGIPMPIQCMFEIRTNGKLKADRAEKQAA